MNDTVAITIPIHPPKYDYARNIFSNDIDIYFIFSFAHEEVDFRAKYIEEKYFTLVLEDNVPIDVIRKSIENCNIITFKKYYGLLQLERYEFVIPVDAEIKLLNPSLLPSICRNFCQNKRILTMCADNSIVSRESIVTINKSCLDFLSKCYERIHKKMKIDHDVGRYFLWSNIPIYDMRITKDFLTFIGISDYSSLVDSLNWYVFDCILYEYYLVEEHGYEFIHLPDEFHELDQCSSYEQWKQFNEQYMNIHWMFHKCYYSSEEAQQRTDIVMIYHLDR